MRLVFIVYLLFIGFPFISSQLISFQDLAAQTTEENRGVVVQDINIQVKGLSSKAILRNRIRVSVGDSFTNLDKLREALEIGVNELRSTGYFRKEDGINYQISILEETEEGPLPIKIEAQFKDAWTVYPIVYPNYTTSSGFGLKGRLKWDNFLGSLANVTLRLDIAQVRDGDYGWDYDGSLNLSTIRITPSFGINGSFSLGRDARTNGANWKSGLGVGVSFTLPWLQNIGVGMGYSISNSSSFTFAYTGVQSTQPYFSTGLSHGLYLGKTRSSSGGVFRDGYSFSVGNSYGFDSDSGGLTRPQKFALEDISFNFSFRLSRSYLGIINLKGRAGLGKSFDFSNGSYNKNGYNYDANSYNRGKRDGLAKGSFVAYLNMDMAILVFSDNILGDVLLEPFLDMTWLDGPNGFQLEDTVLGAGFDLIWIFHSLKFRFSYGIDLHNPELFNIAITTGFFF